MDAHASVTHIDNKKDPTPTLPGIFLGFHHLDGEIHIVENGAWEKCPSQGNPSTSCVGGNMPNILGGYAGDHLGPYDGVMMRC